ncbi:MAG: NAD-dependent deacylase [Anaerolineae bacterium]|nr:NAD-dependent deacylase [Anaerolineae bacterium]
MYTQALNLAIDLLHRAQHVVALTGAGISTPSGVPDFRSAHTGLWDMADPMEVASMRVFRRSPESFYNWLRPLAYTIFDAAPNDAHRALAQMETCGKLKSVITQNIDMLHTRAGSQTVYEVHGHLREMTCIHCFQVYPAEPYIQGFLEGGTLPRCPMCDHTLKPNVILFGEQLPAQAVMNAWHETQRCDVMLLAGSSLTVYPAAGLPVIARRMGASLILVNKTETPVDGLADVVFHADVVEILPRLATALENMQ